ncbi:MAG TPA: nicotinate-nucleotide adenylyltransferase [Candidatus Acidoferrum sp.]|nr:nicotinate-nucleotide adenylyltransferase [Candidatus Acidoferrum sp.]
MTDLQRLGIFGGSFDPVHNGHLFVAEAVREACELDRVLFVPTREGKHYRNGAMNASAEQRATMIRLAIAANVSFALDESDLAPEASGYTADLLPRLQRRYPDAAFTFIVGGDSLVRSHWQRLDEVVDAVERFVVAPRGGVTQSDLDRALADLDPARRTKIAMIDLPLVAESATLVRERLGAGKSARYLIPEPVHRYIKEHGLYKKS